MKKELVERLRGSFADTGFLILEDAADTIEDLTAKCNHIMTEHGKLLKEVEGLRNKTLEEAAQACEGALHEHGLHSNYMCARFIRARKSNP